MALGLVFPVPSTATLAFAQQEVTSCSAESWTPARARVQTQPVKWPFPPSSAFKALLAAVILFIIPRKSKLRLSHSAGFSGDCCSGNWNVRGIIFVSPWEGFFFLNACRSLSPSVPRQVCEAPGLWLLLAALKRFTEVLLVWVSLPACPGWGD